MTDVIVEHSSALPRSAADIAALSVAANTCFRLRRIIWREGYLSRDGHRLICVLEAPDTESVRQALRAAGASADAIWPTTRRPGPLPVEADVLVVRTFGSPAPPATAQLPATQAHIVGRDHRRVISFFHRAEVSNPSVIARIRHDAEICDAHVESVWAFTRLEGGAGHPERPSHSLASTP